MNYSNNYQFIQRGPSLQQYQEEEKHSSLPPPQQEAFQHQPYQRHDYNNKKFQKNIPLLTLNNNNEDLEVPQFYNQEQQQNEYYNNQYNRLQKSPPSTPAHSPRYNPHNNNNPEYPEKQFQFQQQQQQQQQYQQMQQLQEYPPLNNNPPTIPFSDNPQFHQQNKDIRSPHYIAPPPTSYAPSKSSEQLLDDFLEERVGFGRYQIRTMLHLMLVEFIDGAELVLTSLLIPVLQHQFDIDSFASAFMACTFYFGAAAGAFLSPKISEIRGRRLAMQLSSGCLVLLSLLVFLVNGGFSYSSSQYQQQQSGYAQNTNNGNGSIFAMAFLRFCYGMAFGTAMPLPLAIVAETLPRRLRGKGLVLLNFSLTFGKFYGCCIACMCLHSFQEGNWNLMLLLTSIPAWPLLYLTFFINNDDNQDSNNENNSKRNTIKKQKSGPMLETPSFLLFISRSDPEQLQDIDDYYCKHREYEQQEEFDNNNEGDDDTDLPNLQAFSVLDRMLRVNGSDPPYMKKIEKIAILHKLASERRHFQDQLQLKSLQRQQLVLQQQQQQQQESSQNGLIITSNQQQRTLQLYQLQQQQQRLATTSSHNQYDQNNYYYYYYQASATALSSLLAFRFTLHLWFVWLCLGSMYYGQLCVLPLVLEQSTSTFNQYFYAVIGETPALILSLYFTDLHSIARQNSLTLFFALAAIFNMASYFAGDIGVGLYAMVTRFFLQLLFALLYITSAEVYPSALRTVAFSSACGISRFGAAVMPFITFGLIRVWAFGPFLIFAVVGAAAVVSSYYLDFDMQKKADVLVKEQEEQFKVYMQELKNRGVVENYKKQKKNKFEKELMMKKQQKKKLQQQQQIINLKGKNGNPKYKVQQQLQQDQDENYNIINNNNNFQLNQQKQHGEFINNPYNQSIDEQNNAMILHSQNYSKDDPIYIRQFQNKQINSDASSEVQFNAEQEFNLIRYMSSIRKK